MSDYEHILLEKDHSEGIALLYLARPRKRNALNDQTMIEMGDAIADVHCDDGIRVLVLSGKGNAFSAGGDLSALRGGNEPGAWVSKNVDDIRRSFRPAQRMILGLQHMERPVIAMIDGFAVGAGLAWTAPATFVSALPGLVSWWPTCADAVRNSRKPNYEGR